ncbi:MAG: hypothetical protein RR768_06170 [Clostridium sp.]
MKIETLLYDALKSVIPADATKTVLFAEVGETSYEIQFFSLLQDAKQYQQCFQMAEQGALDENALDGAFERIADLIRRDEQYKQNKINIFTLIVDKNGVRLAAESFDRNARVYQIKKLWKEQYLT